MLFRLIFLIQNSQIAETNLKKNELLQILFGEKLCSSKVLVVPRMAEEKPWTVKCTRKIRKPV